MLILPGAKKLIMPHRLQIGGTCGLYALGMVMDYWHHIDPTNVVANVQVGDSSIQSTHTFTPNTDRYIYDVAADNGFFEESIRLGRGPGGMFVASELGYLGTTFGYDYAVSKSVNMPEYIRQTIDDGIPPMIAFDIDDDGQPVRLRGDKTHWGVCVGYYKRDIFIKHGWPRHGKLSALNGSHLSRSNAQIQSGLRNKIVKVFPQGWRPERRSVS